jgi:hypothetical protein
MRAMTESLNMSPAPAVRCSSCEFAWNSAAMAEGLRVLGSCPKCGGELAFRGEPAAAVAADRSERVVPARTAPHLVLGIPRR